MENVHLTRWKNGSFSLFPEGIPELVAQFGPPMTRVVVCEKCACQGRGTTLAEAVAAIPHTGSGHAAEQATAEEALGLGLVRVWE